MNFKINITQSLPEGSPAYDIRHIVFVEEQGFENEFDETDKIAYHAVVYKNDTPAATGRLYDDEDIYYIGRVAVLPEYRKDGLGSLVIKALEDKAIELGGQEISLSAQVQAKGFYEKLGYTSCDDLHYDEFCPHVTMIKKI